MYVAITKWSTAGRVEKYVEFTHEIEALAHQGEHGGIVDDRPAGQVFEWRVLPDANQVIYDPPGPTPEDVNAERDRRLDNGFAYDFGEGDIAFQTDLKSRENIVAAATMAQVAIVAGAEKGDLRWSDPDRDFAWVAADNRRVPMCAHVCLAFCMAAMAYKESVIIAARNLKDLSPIPEDYAADDHWP